MPERPDDSPEPVLAEPVNPASPPAPPPEDPRGGRPPLSILHFLLWTAASAGLLALYRAIDTFRGTESEEETIWRSFDLLMRIGYSMFLGAMLTGAGIVLYHRFRGRLRNIQPGEWLLVCQSGLVLLAIVFYSPFWFRGLPNPPNYWMIQFVQGGILCVAVVVFVTIAIFARQAGPWRVLFASVAGLGLLEATAIILDVIVVGDWFSWGIVNLRNLASIAGALIGTAILIVLIVIDYIRRQRRGWLHNLGVGTYLLAGLFSLIGWVGIFLRYGL